MTKVFVTTGERTMSISVPMPIEEVKSIVFCENSLKRGFFLEAEDDSVHIFGSELVKNSIIELL